MKFILLALLLIPLTHAADAYHVKDVTIELEGENPEDLRNDALTLGKKEALAQLLQQMTPESEWGKHAWILADENADTYIKSLNINTENAADESYTLSLNATFDAAKTRRMLLKHNLSFTETEEDGLIRADKERILFVRFKAPRAQDIERMQTALGNLSVVSNVSPRLISTAESVFMVHMYSDIPAFLRAAERAGLTAQKQGKLYEVNFTP